MNITNDVNQNLALNDSYSDSIDNIIKIDQKMVKGHLGQIFKRAVEDS